MMRSALFLCVLLALFLCAAVPLPPVELGTVDDFEGGAPAGTEGWKPSRDAEGTQVSCEVESDPADSANHDLVFTYDAAPGGWGACSLWFDAPQDWSAVAHFAFQAIPGAENLSVDTWLYTGRQVSPEIYTVTFQPQLYPDEAIWVERSHRMVKFERAAWQEGAGTPYDRNLPVIGVAFAARAPQDGRAAGSLRLDNVRLQGPSPSEAQPGRQASPAPPAGRSCPGSLAGAGLALLAGVVLRRRG